MTIVTNAPTFQRRLLAWYRRHGRRLPWRDTRDPYKVLVSEIMLQQTQVDRVVPKYHEFLRKFPTVRALAKARPAEVRKTWYPLGYNIRPYRLHSIARESVAKYGGRIPDRHEDLLAMDGIGRYTAGAVMTFAHGKPAPILDTNVARVLARVFYGYRGSVGDLRARTPYARQGDAGSLGARRGGARPRPPLFRDLWALSDQLLQRAPRAGYDFNQALMDLGAQVCTARAPACPRCPVRRVCKAYPWRATS